MEGSRADREKKRADCGESMRGRQRTRQEVALQAGKGREQSRPQSGGPSTSATIECGEEAAKHFAFESGYINLNHGGFFSAPTKHMAVTNHHTQDHTALIPSTSPKCVANIWTEQKQDQTRLSATNTAPIYSIKHDKQSPTMSMLLSTPAS